MLPKEYSEDLRRLIGIMLRKDARTRPNPEGVLKELLRLPNFNESKERFGIKDLTRVDKRGVESEYETITFDDKSNDTYKPEDYYGQTSNKLRHGKGNLFSCFRFTCLQ